MRKINSSFWQDKRVLITGHTGFKGTWLTLLLSKLGSKIFGLALPALDKSLFTQSHAIDLIENRDKHFCDISDFNSVRQLILECKPDIVIHMAAQPLVIKSYQDPRETWQTNVMGTVNVLTSLLEIDKQCSAIVVTTDKVYSQNFNESTFTEDSIVGGIDPYSASKAACEFVAESFDKSFYRTNDKYSNISISTVRAGNVIGGGDWSPNRIIPDFVIACHEKKTLYLRNPLSVRPWQHVLEPLCGYLLLAESLYNSDDNQIPSAFNFGPTENVSATVIDLINTSRMYWPNSCSVEVSQNDGYHEAAALMIDSTLATQKLDWAPKWNFKTTIEKTVLWYYKLLVEQSSAIDLCYEDISIYLNH